jgi:hypothetical protein
LNILVRVPVYTRRGTTPKTNRSRRILSSGLCHLTPSYLATVTDPHWLFHSPCWWFSVEPRRYTFFYATKSGYHEPSRDHVANISIFDRGGFRLRSRVETDPASRAASIHAARQAFSEKRLRKLKKAEKEELRALERENRKRENGKTASAGKEMAKIVQSKEQHLSEKQAPVSSMGYSDMPPASNLTNAAASMGGDTGARNPSVSSAARSRWVLFLTWLRTKIFKLGKKVSPTS